MPDVGDAPTARQMWQALETIHAIVYFAPEVAAAYKRVGLKGFWMGYFAGRAAAFGAATPELVTATFFNFHPMMVRRSLPDAWSFASPAAVTAAQHEGVERALHRLLGDATSERDGVRVAADLAAEAVAGCSIAGRPLFAAHASVPTPDAPVLALWHAATLLREHRGDGHVAANVAQGFDGLDAHLTLTATGTVPRASIQPNRGWSDDEWQWAAARLGARGLLSANGELTAAGAAARQHVEDTTDRLAAEPWRHLGGEQTKRLHDLLLPAVRAIRGAEVIPFPNPMGLPAPST